ncbi:4-hydroxybenzoate 3-monooxygenase [Modestobacter sp. I12A-02628]|uniref:4-hydroxybenzoate 3-monooxygenase n=1 Tax=Goekera deserti TaxID=2497753 RepID=A0A7K3W9F9_9ACTN|nr:4-hydroxybenzoate 3-monooxygenase [Goekera deserti]MPQ98684.1 4-hydroxybenzoate 3-monooxygenase [Goekera deserti]NDI49246.1 4-hydroxybenzoate 3-monooxygenase [Goekera deserti]NEL52984.1 4-hydroxybenzoate 3-monooxygenase [Goekera deserti]
MRTQVGIIGGGPAGLLLSRMLAAQGVDSVVLENRSRSYVEARVRAGILEQHSVQTLTDLGLGERLHREGMEHHGIHLQFPGTKHHLDFPALCGRTVWIYGQTEVVKDLVAAQLDGGPPLLFEVTDVQPEDVDGDSPRIRFTDSDGVPHVLECDVIAGTDGFHGVSRPIVAQAGGRTWERTYPFSWLGILADVAPSTDDLVYAWHPDGFAMHSMRSPSVSRLYVQVDNDDSVDNWSDDRIWEALATRMAHPGWELRTGPISQKSITPMRSFVSAPMRRGRLFLAGDAAHIVPPTGAKGLNLAVADVTVLATALVRLLQEKETDLVDAYSDTALARVWRCTHFSWWMTSMLHRSGDDFDAELALSQLRRVCTSEAAARELAENYTGLPIG